MRINFTFSSILLLILLVSCAPNPAASTSQNKIELSSCVLTNSSGRQVNAKCGSLFVPENRSIPQGRQIELYIVVIPAISRNPEPDPLFLLAGGPGQSAVEAFQSFATSMLGIYETRDIVLVDQRGTGKSNPLRCLALEEEIQSDEEVVQSLQSCPQRLDADVRYYFTEIAMQDLDNVREGLGYEKINLYGASYGSRAALTYLRMFPERVRTVTLDAVVDADFVMFLDAAQDGQRALNSFFSRCAADAACKDTFPNLQEEFFSILERLEDSPKTISIPHPVSNKPLEIVVTRQVIISMVFNLLYSADLSATLPLAIHSIFKENNFAPLIAQAYMMDARIYDGMFYAVTCTEDAPLIDPDQAAAISQGSIFGNQTSTFVEICDKWPKGEVSPAFRSPVQSDAPVLIFSGQSDPITPPRHAEQAAKSLRNHLHIVIPNMGHGNLANMCTFNILKSFIASASTEELDLSCVVLIEPLPFFIDFSGPLP
jgi:pimeloyl-ACP methyl ester carboxylesterase